MNELGPDWCSYRGRLPPADEALFVHNVGGRVPPRGKKVRCPTCGRRLSLAYHNAERGYNEWWPHIPPHKVRKTKRKRA